MGVVTLTTGVPGAGKTYIRCARFLVDSFLTDSETSRHISNFPVRANEIAEEIVLRNKSFFSRLFRKRVNQTAEEIEKRIVVIPQDVIDSWKAEKSGPWDYFADWDLNGCHIALDELHEFCGLNISTRQEKKWENWLATIRHLGCTIEGITQDVTSVNPVFINRVSLRIEIVSPEDLKEPYFGIRIQDLVELRAKIFGNYKGLSVVHEYTKSSNGRWKNVASRFVWIDEFYFKFYNSYNKSSTDNGAPSVIHEYQRKSTPQFIAWFLLRNSWGLLSRFALVAFIIWLSFFGGAVKCIDWFSKEMHKQMSKQGNFDANGIKVESGTEKIAKNLEYLNSKNENIETNPFPNEQIYVPELRKKMTENKIVSVKRPSIVVISPNLAILEDNQILRENDEALFEDDTVIVQSIDFRLCKIVYSDGSHSLMRAVSSSKKRSKEDDYEENVQANRDVEGN